MDKRYSHKPQPAQGAAPIAPADDVPAWYQETLFPEALEVLESIGVLKVCMPQASPLNRQQAIMGHLQRHCHRLDTDSQPWIKEVLDDFGTMLLLAEPDPNEPKTLSQQCNEAVRLLKGLCQAKSEQVFLQRLREIQRFSNVSF